MHFYFYFILIFGGIIFQVFIPGFPKELLLIQSGLVYGFVLGGIINWIAMILAAQVAYEVVRRSIETGGKLNESIDRFFNHYQHMTLIKKLETKGNFGLFFIRLLPYAPNDVLSLIAGALMLPRKGFFLVSVITALPFAFFFSYLGSISQEYFDNSFLIKINLVMIISSMVLIIFLRISGIKKSPKIH